MPPKTPPELEKKVLELYDRSPRPKWSELRTLTELGDATILEVLRRHGRVTAKSKAPAVPRSEVPASPVPKQTDPVPKSDPRSEVPPVPKQTGDGLDEFLPRSEVPVAPVPKQVDPVPKKRPPTSRGYRCGNPKCGHSWAAVSLPESCPSCGVSF